MPPKGSTQRGVPSGRFFGDFLIGEKVTQGGGAERPLTGECRGGLCPLAYRGPQGPPPLLQLPRGNAVPPLPIPRNEQKVAPQRATIKQKNLPSAGKNLRCAAANARIGRAIMAQQKSGGIFPRFFAAYSKFSGAFDIPSRSHAPCCGCAWRSRPRRFPAG